MDYVQTIHLDPIVPLFVSLLVNVYLVTERSTCQPVPMSPQSRPMRGEPPLAQKVWERIPPEAQAYIRALEARAHVQAQPAAYMDETGWRERWQRARLWAAVTAGVTVFVIRCRAVARWRKSSWQSACRDI
jgi:hypothetical protein